MNSVGENGHGIGVDAPPKLQQGKSQVEKKGYPQVVGDGMHMVVPSSMRMFFQMVMCMMVSHKRKIRKILQGNQAFYVLCLHIFFNDLVYIHGYFFRRNADVFIVR